ncbi:uncharacterized protein LOC103516415 [Diaphorina citri]|uniref:DNA helicase n=1 Tax=Diaphorina citri TaxID=121845 RepID=A0A3Q0J852_DIACI|nr:uncharacterized protein LOC103516415 [Diaphorina citri]
MKPTKSKDTKNQPKISTFLVPSNPFSNKSPSKQLKISSFFTKVNAKNSQEENICSKSGVKLLLSSPECIPGSPDQPKKRKRNDEPCKRKLFKLDNYNKLLYDPTDNDDCQIIESTPSEKQINHEPKEKIKNSSIVGRSHELKNVLVQQNPSHENNEQASFKSKSGAQSFSKFQTRTDKILSNVIKTTEDNIPPNKLSKLHVKTTNTHINSEEHKQKRGMSKQSNISNVDTKSNLNNKNIGKSDQSVHFKNKKNDKDQKMNTCSRKPSICDKVTVQKPSILENDDLLDQLLGELDTNVRDKNLEQDKYDHTIKEKEYTDCSKQTVDNILIGNFGSKSPLVELNGNILSPNRNENAPKPTNREENSLEFKNVKNSLEENIDILCDQEVVNIGHPLVINESGKTTLNELPQRKNSSQKSEEAVQLSINADCEHNLQMPTPVKEAKCEEYTPIINVPRTPEKSEEVSSISQEVAAVLSATKSPILSSPSKKLIPDLSFISKINFDDDDEEWNFSQIDNLQKLDLTRFNKCEILNMETITGSQLKLCLKPCDSTENTTTWCLVMGSWVHTQLNVGDIINIKAEYSNEYQSWIVDNSRGLIVFQPDILVSGTSVVGALFCMRKSILSDLFNSDGSWVLKGNLRTDSELRKVIESLISSQDTILMLYGSLMSLEDTKAELTSFIPRIQNFLATYVDSKKPPGKSTWDGRYACSLSRSYPIPSLVFSLSQYVIVSSSTQPAVASGFITALNENSLGLNLDRDLSALSAGGSKFHVDTYESQSLLSFNLIGKIRTMEVLKGNLRTDSELRKVIESLISSQDTILMLYGSLMSLEDTKAELTSFIPRIQNFLATYVDSKKPPGKSTWDGQIVKVQDIEENIWLPNLGIKGKVDVTVKVRSRNVVKTLPLELKTGRASRSAEHRGQVILYAMMMSEMGDQAVDSGLLLYLRFRKSSTLACLIELFVRLKLSVLVTSHTHSAVDNLLIRLIDRVPFLRLVVGVTCMGSVHPLLTKRTFNVCIVDEATQVLLPAVLPPLLSAEKFVLVGDPEQLSPLVVSREASELGLSESLFSRLDRPVVTTCLTAQYRMNRFITQLVNRFTYQGRLECANQMVETATIPELNFNTDQVWLQKCLSHQLESSVIFLNVNCDNANEAANQNEANVIHTIVTALVQSGIPTDHIGVIATYRNQVSLLKRLLDKDIEINTVDQYQGRDKSIILYSSTCTSKSKESKILNDRKRLTVAISRAKHKLIILGDLQVIAQSHPVLNELVKYVGECGSVVDVPL